MSKSDAEDSLTDLRSELGLIKSSLEEFNDTPFSDLGKLIAGMQRDLKDAYRWLAEAETHVKAISEAD